jgi:hypothetical protein
LLEIERGQFLCGIESCSLNVRFDQGSIVRYSASEPSDNSSTVLFINNEPTFLDRMRHARTVTIEATFFQEGSQALTFNIQNFRPS